MATEQSLPFNVASVVEAVLQQHGTRLSDVGLASRKAEEASVRRYEAAGWLRKTVGVVGGKDLPAEPSEEDFRLGLRSGIILCNVINKVQPGAVAKVVEGPCDSVPIPDGAALSAFQYFENVRNFLVAVEELGLPTFEASDLEQGGKSASTRIVNCVLAPKSYSDWKQAGGSGSWKFVGNLKPPISGKPFLRKNSEPFMSSFTRTLSWSERSQDSFSSEDPNEAVSEVKAPSKDSPGPDSDSPSLSEPGSGDIKNEEKAATEIKKDDCCNQTYDHQEGSKEKYSGMHLHGLAHAASGYQKVLEEHRHNTSVAAGYIRDSAFEPQCWAAPGIHMIPAST